MNYMSNMLDETNEKHYDNNELVNQTCVHVRPKHHGIQTRSVAAKKDGTHTTGMAGNSTGKDIAVPEKKKRSLPSVYIPSDDEVVKNDDGTLKIEYDTDKDEKTNRTFLSKKMSINAVVSSLTTAPLSLFSLETLTGQLSDYPLVGVIVSIFTVTAASVLAIYATFEMVPVKMRPLLATLTPTVTKWLQESYGVVVSERVAQTIVFKMLTYPSYERKDIKLTAENGRKYRFANTREWRLTYTNGRDVPVKLAAIKRPSLSVNSAVSSTPIFRVEEQKEFFNKITLLEKQPLTAEEKYVVERAKKESRAAEAASTLLENLGDSAHLEALQEVLSLINTELDTIINKKQQDTRSQLKITKDVLQERLQKPFTLTD